MTGGERFETMCGRGEGNALPWDGANSSVVEYPDAAEIDRLQSMPDTSRVLVRGTDQTFKDLWARRWQIADVDRTDSGVWVLAAPPRRFSRPLWSGEPGTVLIHHDMGYGDEFYYLRYLLEMVKTRGNVRFETRKSTLSLARTLGVDAHEKGGDVGYDYHMPLRHLDGLFKVDNLKSYIVLPGDPLRTAMGFCWRGSVIKFERRHAVPSAVFRVAASSYPGPVLAFQRGERVSWAVNAAEGDWLDTARGLNVCRLVVSVDTGVAHLAGAMGVETVVLHANFSPLWYDLPSYGNFTCLYGTDRQVFEQLRRRLGAFYNAPRMSAAMSV